MAAFSQHFRLCRMSLILALINLLFTSCPFAHATQPAVVRYGKYYAKTMDGSRDFEASTYYLYSPERTSLSHQLPIIIHFHGGGFIKGSAHAASTPEIEMYLRNGFHYLSADYRLVGTKYYFTNPAGSEQEEEFIHARSDGTLVLDTAGKPMSSYQVRIGRQEFNTKCSYDASVMLEHLLEHASEYGVDVHRIGFTGDSAGGGEIQYLTWVYHGLGGNSARYSPRSMVYTLAQLDYTVQNILDRVWSIWTDAVGSDTKLSTILDPRDCYMIVGNPECEDSSEWSTDICNQTWNRESMARFCGDKFGETTLGSLRDSQRWPMETEQDKGLAKLWYSSENMQIHQPRPFYLYVANWLNGTAGLNVVHNAVYARGFAKYAKLAGINYTCYWTDYLGMKPEDQTSRRYEVPGRHGATVYNYFSSIDFAEQAAVAKVPRVSLQERLLHNCLALDVKDCDASILPPSPPSPVPASCDAVLAQECPHRASPDCAVCVRRHAVELKAGGCPKGTGAGAQVIQHWCHGQEIPVVYT